VLQVIAGKPCQAKFACYCWIRGGRPKRPRGRLERMMATHECAILPRFVGRTRSIRSTDRIVKSGGWLPVGSSATQSADTVGRWPQTKRLLLSKSRKNAKRTHPFYRPTPRPAEIGFALHTRSISKFVKCFQLDGLCFAFFFLIGVPSASICGQPRQPGKPDEQNWLCTSNSRRGSPPFHHFSSHFNTFSQTEIPFGPPNHE
jgi:hypothetical protein